MGKTLSEWLTDKGIAETNNKGEGDTLPMNNVNWYDALVFCNKMSIAENLTPVYKLAGSTNPDSWGTVPTNAAEDASIRVFWDAVEWNHEANGYRLPTEAEWEYACRAGTTTRYNTGDTTADLERAAWYGEGSSGHIHPVGTKTANNWGIFDMHGNVAELCWDLYLAAYYASSPAADPLGPASNTNGNRVNRGGAATNPALNEPRTNDVAYSARRMNGNALRSAVNGFRLVRNAP
jgi:formylglycine-generating enzyme required for sulfatase activity